MDDDNIFKALADPSRRQLLDALFKEDGQTLTELCGYLPMSRYGVMKHLGVLEEANLLTTEKVGREKHHYLNAVPIQQVYDRWVSKYTRQWAQTMTTLKHTLEAPPLADKHIQQIFIRTTPEKLWQALIESDATRHYYFGSEVDSDWQAGSAYRYPRPDGGTYVEGEIITIEPPHRLVMSFRPVWQYANSDAAAPTSQVTWTIEADDKVCKLTLVHEDLDMAAPKTQEIVEGWARILSGLKTYMETGTSLS